MYEQPDIVSLEEIAFMAFSCFGQQQNVSRSSCIEPNIFARYSCTPQYHISRNSLQWEPRVHIYDSYGFKIRNTMTFRGHINMAHESAKMEKGRLYCLYLLLYLYLHLGRAVAQVGEALRHKSGSPGFDSWWGILVSAFSSPGGPLSL